jgi:hypothetical protein
MKTIEVEITEELAQALEKTAATRGLTLEQYLIEIATDRCREATGKLKTAEDTLRDLKKAVEDFPR